MKTKQKFSLKTALFAVCLTLGLSAFAPPANAQSENFNTTNVVNNATSLANLPTNSVGTNGIGQNTGGAINVKNYPELGVLITGQVAGASNGTVVLNLVRSGKDSPPAVAADWETSSSMSLSASTDASGRLYWITNLPSHWVRPATWIGCSLVTNTSPGTSSITNFAVKPVKKIIPVTWP
jgi:hypothetical protein